MMNSGMGGPPQYSAGPRGGPGPGPGPGVSNGMQQIPPSGPMMRAQVKAQLIMARVKRSTHE